MWQYVQATGGMYDPAGNLLSPLGYSGNWTGDPADAGGPNDYRNRPDQQCVIDHGPIPRGTYTIGAAHTDPEKGPVVMALAPDAGNFMCDPKRAGFLIHGDKIGTPGTASDGCIIMNRTIRDTISASADSVLMVVGTIADLMPPA